VRAHRGAGDEGSTLIETLVALSLVMVTMSAMGTFFVNSVLTVSAQRVSQTAAQVANTAIEQVRGLRGNSLAANHAKDRVALQWSAAPAVVAPYLADMDQAYDALAAVGAGDDSAISTATQSVLSDGTTFSRTIYVGACYLYTGLPTGTANAYSNDISTNCQPQALSTDAILGKFVGTPRELQFYRAVVLIQWPGRSCPAGTCSSIVTTLVSRQAEPTFDVHQPPPVIQTASIDVYQGTAVSFLPIAKYGQLPNAWTATGLPSGLAITQTTPTSGYPIYSLTGTATTVGISKPVFTVTDSLGRTDTEQVTINVWAPLALTGLTSTTGHVGDTVSMVAKATGGVTTSPGYTYAATGLPSWLTLSTTGTITGTATTAGSYPLTVTVTDANQTLDTPASVKATFTYTVVPAVVLATIADQRVNAGSALNVTAVGSGGDGTLTYSAAGLPLGMAINSATGLISGSSIVPGRYLPVVTVTDGSAGSASQRFSIEVDALTGLVFTSPGLSAPDQASAVGQQVNVSINNNGKTLGLSPVVVVTGLPPGLSYNAASGNVNGKATTAGTYVVTAVATNLLPPQTSNLVFLWTVS
jgi:type II secretory pathway pseudopilin PulG